MSHTEPQRTVPRKLAPPSELEQTLAFEVEFGVTAEAIRQAFLDDLRAWYERTTSGAQASTKPFRIVMRDVGLRARGTSPDVVLARASSVVRAASTEQLAVYERWRRKETP